MSVFFGCQSSSHAPNDWAITFECNLNRLIFAVNTFPKPSASSGKINIRLNILPYERARI